MTTGNLATRIYLVEPDLLYYTTNIGGLYYTFPSDPTMSGKAVGSVGYSTNDRLPGRLYFLNAQLGFVVGEIRAPYSTDTVNPTPISITYDGGLGWAHLLGAGTDAGPIDAIGLRTWVVMGNTLLNSTGKYVDSVASYSLTSGPLNAVVTGRFTDIDGVTGIAGGRVILHGLDGNDYTTYTTEKGYYVATDLPVGFASQELSMTFTDSTGNWSKSVSVTLRGGDVATVDFVHPLNSKVEVSENPQPMNLRYVLLQKGAIRFETSRVADDLTVQIVDVLGRTVLSYKYSGATEFEIDRGLLAPGVYYCDVHASDGGHATCKFVVER